MSMIFGPQPGYPVYRCLKNSASQKAAGTPHRRKSPTPGGRGRNPAIALFPILAQSQVEHLYIAKTLRKLRKSEAESAIISPAGKGHPGRLKAEFYQEWPRRYARNRPAQRTGNCLIETQSEETILLFNLKNK